MDRRFCCLVSDYLQRLSAFARFFCIILSILINFRKKKAKNTPGGGSKTTLGGVHNRGGPLKSPGGDILETLFSYILAQKLFLMLLKWV